IDAIAEVRGDSKNFIVAKAGVDSQLHDEVRQFVGRVTSGINEIVEATTAARSKGKEVLKRCDGPNGGSVGVGTEATSTEGELRRFDGNRSRNLIAKGLGNAEAILPFPVEAHNVLRIDHEGNPFLPKRDTLDVFGRKTPSLAAAEGQAVFQANLSPDLPLAKHIAVPLPVVGSNACAEPISFIVAGQFGAADLALGEEAETGLTSSEIHFAEVASRVSAIGNRIERRVDVGTESVLTVNRFRSDEAARGEVDPFEAYGCGTLLLIGRLRLGIRGRGGIHDRRR